MDTKTMTMEYRLHHWAGVIKECKESGLSVKTFCKNGGFHENRYYYWQKKLREKACNEILNIKGKASGMIPSGFTEVKVSERYLSLSPVTHSDNQINIEIPGIRFVAGADYPTEKLVRIIQEMRPSC